MIHQSIQKGWIMKVDVTTPDFIQNVRRQKGKQLLDGSLGLCIRNGVGDRSRRSLFLPIHGPTAAAVLAG